MRFVEQHFAKRAEHLQQQIEFPQTLAAGTHGAQKKLELNPATAIRNRHHVVAPLVLTTTTRFDFSEYVGSVTG